MKKNNLVSVVIPAYNEENIIGKTLNSLSFDWIKEVIVINDASRDNTLKIIYEFKINSELPVKIINQETNLGKGKAVEAGLNQVEGELVALVDADLGTSVKEIENLVVPVIDNSADITIAVLPIRGGGLGLVRQLADRGIKYVIGYSMQAPLSGQRVFQTQILKDILPLAEDFGLEIGMDIDILRKGYRIQEINCNFNHKITGKDFGGYLHRGKQFLSILKTFWHKR